MAEHDSSSTRVGYIRTVTNPDKTAVNIYSLLNSRLRQSSPYDVEQGRPRHRFIFGAVNTPDADILDTLIAKIPARTLDQADTTETENTLFITPLKYIARSDFELRISQARATTASGQKTLKRCADEGIPTIISGDGDEECDEIALQQSDYLIDFLTNTLLWNYDNWFYSFARPGVPQNNMLTNPNYNVDQHNASIYRLRNRYAGYGWKASSGAYHGNGPWGGCGLCGGNCKRRQCKGEGRSKYRKGRIAERKEWEEREDQRARELSEVLGPGNVKWRGESTRDMITRFWMLRRAADVKGSKRWRSVDTFSGE